ncbi:MAG TPA: LysR substrate-binding domain-containing protein [Rhodanobacter sp.]|jgi:LysR family glycine cleavage system transcriptional activator|nr:LysR substrate-binding domain-containing protein [Rhodanobacter sp.]
MKYVLPPMHTLRTFEALGRLRHFTRTAEELHLTASAVSHQIRAIESFYGMKLFQRNRHDVMLTSAGERLMSVVRLSLDQLSEVGVSLRHRDSARLSITAPPSLASRWLMPRLGVFLTNHPDIDFKLHATLNLMDLDADEIDLGIRYGSGRWKGLRGQKLFDEQLFPVASPAYMARQGIRKATDLRRCVLLRDDFQTWDSWFEKTKTSGDGSTFGPDFSDSALLLQAAEAGQGVAMARSLLVADAIEAGTLVRIGKIAIVARDSYYLVSSSRRPDTYAVKAFSTWMAELAEKLL